MAQSIDFEDTEYVWPPGALGHEPPAPGPAIAAMRIDSIEQRVASIERKGGDIARQLVGIDEAVTVAIDALTYLSGAVERLRAIQ